MVQEDSSRKATGSHPQRVDPVQRASADQELSEGMKAPGTKHNEWLRKMLGLAGGAYTLLGKSFMPTLDEGDIIMQLEKLPSISLDQTVEIVGAERAVEVAPWALSPWLVAQVPLLVRAGTLAHRTPA